MSYALLWIEALIGSLLWVAMLAACIARLKRRRIREILTGLVVLGPVLLLGVFAAWAGLMKFMVMVSPNWFGYAFSLWVAVLTGSMVIVALARRGDKVVPLAATWRRAPLAAAWVAAMAVGGMTFWNIDLAVLARANILAMETQTKFYAEMPAIISDSQNAATLYEAAFARLAADPPVDVQSWPTGKLDSFDPNEPAIKTFLTRQARTIALLQRAAAMPSCRFEQDLGTLDFDAVLPSLNHTRLAAEVLCMHGCYEAANGRMNSAMADVVAVRQMSRQFGQRPLLVSGLVAFGIDALGDELLRRILPAATQPGDLANLDFDDTGALRRILRRALEGEMCFGLGRFRQWAGGAVTPDSQGASAQPINAMAANAMPWPIRDFWLPSELDAYLSVFDTARRASFEPYYKSKPMFAELQAQGRLTSAHMGMFSAISAPSMARTFVTVARVEATDACAQAAVAMTRYRLDHGALPSHLSDLVPAYLDAVPTDPFGGQPIHLAVKNSQWIIYSIGPDEVDDGGVAMDTKQKGDIIYVLTPTAIELTTQPTTQP